MLNACAEAHAFASLTQWKCSILGVLLPFLALNWLNIRFFLCWAPKLNFCGEIGQFLTLKLKFFHSFGPKTEIKTIIFSNWSIFGFILNCFRNFWLTKSFLLKKLINFSPLYSIFPKLLAQLSPSLSLFFLKIGQFLAFILNFSNNFWPKKSFFFLL